MKAFPFFVLLIFVFSMNTLGAQNALEISIKAQPALADEWQISANGTATFQKTFGKTAATNWISELAVAGTFYEHPSTGGFLVVLPKYIQTKAKCEAKFQYGIFENKQTRLLPILDQESVVQNVKTMRFMGYIGGIPASLDMAVIKENNTYLTVMGFLPGQELATDLSLYMVNEPIFEQLNEL